MDVLRKILAGLCALLFVLIGLVALLLFNFERRAFNPSTYKQALADQNIYEQVPALVGAMMTATINREPCADNPIACRIEARPPQALACFESALGKQAFDDIVFGGRQPSGREIEQAQGCLDQYPLPPVEPEDGPPTFIINLTAEEWQDLVTALLPPEEMKSLMDQVFDSIFAVLNGRAETASLDVTSFKNRLSGPAGVEAVLTMLHAQPPCTVDQIAAMTISTLNLQGNLELCSPSDELAFVIQPLIEINLQLAVLAIPDQVTIIGPQMDLSGEATPLESMRILRLAMRLTPLAPLMFLLGLTIFGVRSLTNWLRWWGWPFLVLGVLGLLIGLSSGPLLSLALTQILLRRLPDYLPVGVVDLGGQVVDAIVREILKPVVWESLLFVVISGTMLFIAGRIPVRASHSAAAEAETEIFNDQRPSST
jgi:hypothetical protein